MREKMPAQEDLGGTVEASDGRTERGIRYVIIGMAATIVLILTVVLYGLLSGVINPPAPRTASEFAIARAKEMITKTPKDGQYWADYVDLLVAQGSLSEAESTIAQARKAVGTDDTQLIVNNSELRLLLAQKKFQKAFDLSTKYMEADKNQRSLAMQKLAARGIKASDNLNAARQALTVELMSLRALAAVELKKYDDADAALVTAIRADPMAADVRVFHAQVLILKGDKKSLAQAKGDIDDALQFIPDFQPALDLRKELEQMSAGKAEHDSD